MPFCSISQIYIEGNKDIMVKTIYAKKTIKLRTHVIKIDKNSLLKSLLKKISVSVIRYLCNAYFLF